MLPVAPEDDAQLLAWFDEGVEEMLAVFGAQDPEGPAWNWSLDEQVASFWPRRMALETAVHRWDAENTVRRPTRLRHREVAIDGIDEVLRVHLPADRHEEDEEEHGSRALEGPGAGQRDRRSRGLAGRAHAVRRGGHRRRRRSHRAGADAAVRGPLSDLYLMLWGRVDIDLLDVTGDPALVAAVRTS